MEVTLCSLSLHNFTNLVPLLITFMYIQYVRSLVTSTCASSLEEFESANLPQMEDKTVAEGEGFSLSCNDYVSVGGVSVLWNKQVNGIQELINAGEVLGTKDKQLYFPHARSPQHDAVYSCSVVNLVTNVVRSGSFNVRVSGLCALTIVYPKSRTRGYVYSSYCICVCTYILMLSCASTCIPHH